MFYLIAHALMKGALFMAVGAFAISVRARTVDDFAGIAREAPWSAMAFARWRGEPCGRAADDGLPCEVGADRRRRWQAGAIWIVVVLATGSLLTLVYVGRMLEAIFFRPPVARRGAGEGSAGWRAGAAVHSCGPVAAGSASTPRCRRALADASAAACPGGGAMNAGELLILLALALPLFAAAVIYAVGPHAGCARDADHGGVHRAVHHHHLDVRARRRRRSAGAGDRAADGRAGDRVPAGAAGRAVRGDGERAVGGQLAVLDRLHARHARGEPDAVLHVLCAGDVRRDGHRDGGEPVHAVHLLRGADAARPIRW